MKEYVKPEFFYENYELNMSVAACLIQLDKNGVPKFSKDQEAWAWYQEGGFVSDLCNVKVEGYGYYGGTQIIYGS